MLNTHINCEGGESDRVFEAILLLGPVVLNITPTVPESCVCMFDLRRDVFLCLCDFVRLSVACFGMFASV